MANRYRVIWVKSPYTQEFGHLLMDYPTFNGNTPPTQTQPSRQETYEGMVTELQSTSNNYIHDFPKNMMYCYDKTNSDASSIISLGFNNAIDWNLVRVGDRFYINRWDANHSYFQVTAIENTPYFHIKNFTIKGYTKDGEQVYGDVHVGISMTAQGTNPSVVFFPWIGKVNESPYNLIIFSMHCDERWGTQYGGYWVLYSTMAPTSAALGEKFWIGAEIIEPTPYDGGGYSTTGGGNPQKQNWSENSDIVLPNPMPSETDYGAVSCGLITIFSPTKAQLKKLSEVIWGQGFWNFVQNAIENIADLFVSLAMVPFTVSTGETVEVTWFSYDLGGQVPIGTGIYLTKATNQWYEFDMGTVNLMGSGRGFATDSVLDYSPFSKLGIYLPFIGYQELDIDECRESPINLKYRIDILSGTCVALITINGRTIYQFTGNCLTQLPLTSMDAQTMLSNAVNIGIAAASAGATAAVASAGDAMTAENLAKGDISATAAELQNAQHAASVSNAQGSLTSATANGILGMKPNFKKSGAVSASASLFNVMQPYLFLTTPRQSVPEGYEKVCGFPCNMGGTLGNFDGFTVVEDIRLNGLVATSPEVEEIYQLLKQGVII